MGQKAYTLEECINLAQSRHPDVIIQNLNILRSQSTLEQTRKSRFPTVSGSLSNGLNGGRSIDPFSNSFVQQTISYSSYGLSGNWNVYNGSSIKYQIQQNKLGLEAEQIQLLQVKRDLKFAVIEAFMNVMINGQLLKIQKENKNDLLSQLESINERIREGVLASYNRTETEAQLANLNFEIVNAENNLKLSGIALGQLMMLKDEVKITVPENTEKVKIVDRRQNLNFYPALRVLDKQIASAKYGINLAKAERLPKVSLNGSLGTSYSSAAVGEYSYFRQLGYNFNQYLGMSLSIPIYSSGLTQTRIEAAKIEERIVRQQKEKQSIQLNQQVESLNIEIESLREKLKSSTANVQAQEKLYAGAKEKYKEGLINNLEVNTYRLNLEKAKIQQAQTQCELYFKSEILETFFEGGF